VLVSLTIHETNDHTERTEITISTNTQNPVKPVDLFSNDETISDLSIQCKDKFYDYYFERQTRGFAALSKDEQKRITPRRLLDKNKTARTYLAFATDKPNDAIISESKLFDFGSIYFEKVFANRKIKELIVPHIFMHMLNELDLKWAKEIRSNNYTNKRNKSILHKDIVKYFILNFIASSFNELPAEKKVLVEDKIIDVVSGLDKTDMIPDIFFELAEKSYIFFMRLFDQKRDVTWPEELYQKIRANGYEFDPDDIPTDFNIMSKLKSRGNFIRQDLMRTRSEKIKDDKNSDTIRSALLSLIE